VCGGLRREVKALLGESGVRVLDNVAGEAEDALALLARDELRSGHDLDAGRRAASVERPIEEGGPAEPEVDCFACATRACLAGGACSFAAGPLTTPPASAREDRWLDVGRDITAQTDPKFCRIAELVHFAVGMGYHRIGVAFCWELFREAETLAGVLSRFFTVKPVCCRFGSDVRGDPMSRGPTGNPARMARVLARAGTDLNVAAGLCLGGDLVFAARSRAPVTTLFVKDRSLSHNPVAAIYTRYYLDEIAVPGRVSP
ncbi:MAG: DUF1847 domain-containing protein, partial [Planctomycetes bacterium]|nr:DUF1847 domain-containing protein [Planctomycetota bacterium]